jgi:hypothetical protein
MNKDLYTQERGQTEEHMSGEPHGNKGLNGQGHGQQRRVKASWAEM